MAEITETEAQVKLATDIKAKYEADIAALKSSKDKEISDLRKSHEELSAKLTESDAVAAKLTGEDAAKKKAEAAETLRTKLIKEGIPEETLKFAETEREMHMIGSVYRAARTVNTGQSLDQGHPSIPSSSFDELTDTISTKWNNEKELGEAKEKLLKELLTGKYGLPQTRR